MPENLFTTQNNTSPSKDASLSSSPKPKSQENGNVLISDDTEISIFGAHKYFSDPNLSFWTKSFLSKPTPSSEISQTGLLPNPQDRAPLPTKNFPLDCINKRWHAAKKWLLRRKWCCHGEKSVQVKELEHKKPVLVISANNTINVCQEREQSFTDSIVEIHHIKAKALGHLSSLDAPRQQRITASGRSFIDGAVGFTFPILNPSDENLSKKDVIPCEDDVCSDVSSDLFEIESLSTPCPCPVCRRSSSVDHDHGEASIEVNFAAAEVGGASLDIGDFASLRPQEMGGKWKIQSKGPLTDFACGKEKVVSMKCMAEGPPLHVGGRPPLV